MSSSNPEVNRAGVESREDIKQFIVGWVGAHGYWPTIRDIANGVDLSISTVAHHLERGEKLGVFKKLYFTEQSYVWDVRSDRMRVIA